MDVFFRSLLLLVLFVVVTAASVFVISSPWVFGAIFLVVHGEVVSQVAFDVYAITVPFWQMFVSITDSQLLPQEHSHLIDVQRALGWLFILGLAGMFFLFGVWRVHRKIILDVTRDGVNIGIAVIGVLVMVSVLNWSWFFTQFHRVFFAEGTWQFPINSILIQLFPQSFWITYGVLFTFVFLFTLYCLRNSTLKWSSRKENLDF